MTINEYIQAVNDPGRKYGLLGPIGPVVVYRVEAPARPITRRPAPTPSPRRPAAPAPGKPAPGVFRFSARPAPKGYADGSPHLVCRVCHQPTWPVARTGMCGPCAAEVHWRVGLAQQGLKVVS